MLADLQCMGIFVEIGTTKAASRSTLMSKTRQWRSRIDGSKLKERWHGISELTKVIDGDEENA